MSGRRPSRGGSLHAWLVAILGACLACSEPTRYELPRGSTQWSLVVVLLDALPASGLGAYGYPRDTSPELDRFAGEALRFEEAYASASYTLASVSSLFTGLPPATHGVVGLKSNVLSGEHVTLAEALAAAGLRTAAFSANPHITREGGFAQGFEEFSHYGRDRFDLHAVPAALDRDVRQWWREHADERRFLYVHALPPHQPYDPPAPHDTLFGAGDTRREEGLTDKLVEWDQEGRVGADPGLAARIRARYDAGVHYADRWFGTLLEDLGRDGGLEDCVVVVLSDHGEAFGEHGRLLHGSTVFEEMLRVPLIVRWPGVRPRGVDGLVRTRDLSATLCELLGVPWPAGELLGESFLDRVFVPREARPRPLLSRSVGRYPVWALRTEEHTFVRHRTSKSELLYDRGRDRTETVDLLSAASPGARAEALELGAELDRRLRMHRESPLRPSQSRSDSTHLADIEALGYAED